jgi:DNA polymerase III delta prime subunit
MAEKRSRIQGEDKASISGQGAIAQGEKSIAVADHSVAVGGNVYGDVVLTHEQNRYNQFSKDVFRDLRGLEILRDKVQRFWVRGILENSPNRKSLLPFHLQLQNGMVVGTWNGIFGEPDVRGQNIIHSDRQPLDELFYELGRAVLILGNPGSGKTTFLVELARELGRHPIKSEPYPIPVIFNLSSWSKERKHLEHWLASELSKQYGVGRKTGFEWITNQALIVLLDGLDEVDIEYRKECVTQINRFRERYGPPGVAVCCRTADYVSLESKLALDNAISINPLTDAQIEDYFTCTGNSNLSEILMQRPGWLALARSPLMLNIISLTFQDIPADEQIAAFDEISDNKRLFERYVSKMFNRAARSERKMSNREQTLNWLQWFAQMLSLHNQTEFYIEDIDISWLTTKYNRIYKFCVRMVCVLIFLIAAYVSSFLSLLQALPTITEINYYAIVFIVGSSAGLSTGSSFYVANVLTSILPKHPIIKIFTSVLVALLGGAIGTLILLIAATIHHLPDFQGQSFLPNFILLSILLGLFVGLPGSLAGVLVQTEKIRTSEQLGWRRFAILGPIAGFFIPLILKFSFLGTFVIHTDEIIILGLTLSTILTLAFGLTSSQAVKQTRVKPNQGMVRSGINALRIGIIVVFSIAAIFLLVAIFITPENVANDLGFGLIVVLPMAFAVMLLFGAFAVIQHFTIRGIIAISGRGPWHLVHFLDYAVERIIMQKIGGHYIFIHPLLLKYFSEYKKEAPNGQPQISK